MKSVLSPIARRYRSALWVTLTYVVVAAIWIVASDEVVRRLAPEPAAAVPWQTFKGWGFVLLTGLVLYGVLRRRVFALDRSVAELEARERLLEAINRAAPVGIVVLTRDGAVLSWNPGAAHLLEPAGAQVGRPVPWTDPKGDGPPGWLVRAQGGERLVDAPARIRAPDGTWMDLLVSAGPLENAKGELLGTVAVLSDITRRRALEAQLRQAQKMEALGQVAGGIAHDFRNVLTVLTTVAEGMRARLPADDAELRADLDELIQAAGRGSAITRRLLAFSRLEQMELRPMDLRHVASEAVSVLRRLLPSSIELSVESAPVPVFALVDPNAMIHVLTNLATNARDAMPGGGRLRIAVHRINGDSGNVGGFGAIDVADTGEGMDGPTLKKVFDPFFTTKPAGVGTGLGLPIVQGLVAEQHGTVAIDSAPGRGTTVSLRFPVAAGHPDSAPAAPWPGVIRGGDETVLVVEDEEAIRRSAKRALEQLGYRVLLAGDGLEALELLRGGPRVDLVISDSIMPRLGGAELFERLREAGIHVRFLLASGYTPQETAQGATPHPEVPFLPKPWTLNELTRKVRELLDAD